MTKSLRHAVIDRSARDRRSPKGELMLKVSIAVVACVTGFSTAAFAQDAARPCKADYAKYCSGVTPGGGRIVACLNKQRDQLSDACKTALDARPKQ